MFTVCYPLPEPHPHPFSPLCPRLESLFLCTCPLKSILQTTNLTVYLFLLWQFSGFPPITGYGLNFSLQLVRILCLAPASFFCLIHHFSRPWDFCSSEEEWPVLLTMLMRPFLVFQPFFSGSVSLEWPSSATSPGWTLLIFEEPPPVPPSPEECLPP